MHDEQSNKRSWLLVATWFGTIVFLGVLKRISGRYHILCPKGAEIAAYL